MIERKDLAIVRAKGTDARSFLHAQLTQRMDDIDVGEMRPAAWLTAKGRVRSLVDVVPVDDELLLVLAAANADFLVRELGRYVLRAAIELTVATDLRVVSVTGDADAWLESRNIPLLPRRAAASDGVVLSRTEPDCVDVIGEPPALERWFDGTPESDSDPAVRCLIARGRPEIDAALRDRYTPHMLNLDRIGAVSFSKGCYPGQEVVARTENLGSVKRRALRFRAGPGARPAVGDDVAGPDQDAVGEIVRVAACAGGFELLAVVPIDTAGARLSLGTDGRALEPLALPF